MASAAVEKTEVLIGMSNRKEQLLATGEVLTFDGFMKVYGGGKDDSILPEVKVGQELDLSKYGCLAELHQTISPLFRSQLSAQTGRIRNWPAKHLRAYYQHYPKPRIRRKERFRRRAARTSRSNFLKKAK
jgi:hypothetical protein